MFFEERCKVLHIPWIPTSTSEQPEASHIRAAFIDPDLTTVPNEKFIPESLTVTLDRLFSSEDVDGKRSRAFVTGRTGSGKTTLLLKLSGDWAAGRDSLLKKEKAVFFLHMGNLNHKSNLGEAVRDYMLQLSQFTPGFIEGFIKENEENVTLLLDGFDEFKINKKKPDDCGNIVKLLQGSYCPRVRLLVTTRHGSVKRFRELADKNFKEYSHLEISGFSSASIDDYIRRFFEDREELGVSLSTYLTENNLKMELACLPLMCSALCQLTKWTDGKDFMDMKSKSSLLDKLLKCLLEYHPTSKKPKSPEIQSRSIENRIVKSRRKEMPSRLLLHDLGKVALESFMGISQEEMILHERDFKICKYGEEVIAQGCDIGIIYQDTDHAPTRNRTSQLINLER